MNNLESLHEGFNHEVNDLQEILEDVENFALKAKRPSVKQQLGAIIGNLSGLCDSLYAEFENSNDHAYTELQAKYAVLNELLAEKLDYEEKTYIRLKHGIDL